MSIFNGKNKAEEIESSLRGRTPGNKVLHSIVVGDEGGALKYQAMKKQVAVRIGAKLIIEQFDSDVDFKTLQSKIQNLNSDSSANGIMIQLPLPKNLRHKTKDLIDTIARQKDMDGMRDDSPFVAPVVKAVTIALEEAEKHNPPSPLKGMKTLVVGSMGFVGQKIVKELKKQGYQVSEVDENDDLALNTKNADIIISCAGRESLIKSQMVKDGVILIDVGAPSGDIAKEAYEKASFVSPVPGGIGPVTIACLMENLVV